MESFASNRHTPPCNSSYRLAYPFTKESMQLLQRTLRIFWGYLLPQKLFFLRLFLETLQEDPLNQERKKPCEVISYFLRLFFCLARLCLKNRLKRFLGEGWVAHCCWPPPLATPDNPWKSRLWVLWQHLTRCSSCKHFRALSMPALQREAAWAEEKLSGDLLQSVPQNGRVHLHIAVTESGT